MLIKKANSNKLYTMGFHFSLKGQNLEIVNGLVVVQGEGQGLRDGRGTVIW